jgi:hypothetical protein
MGKLLQLAASGAIGVTMSVTGAAAASAAPAHVAQYNPNVPTTAPADVASITTTPPHGAGSGSGSGPGSIVTTGADSTRLAGEGLALVLAGTGAILIRRRYADRT